MSMISARIPVPRNTRRMYYISGGKRGGTLIYRSWLGVRLVGSLDLLLFLGRSIFLRRGRG